MLAPRRNRGIFSFRGVCVSRAPVQLGAILVGQVVGGCAAVRLMKRAGMGARSGIMSRSECLVLRLVQLMRAVLGLGAGVERVERAILRLVLRSVEMMMRAVV